MTLIIKTLVVGPVETNCYVAADPDTRIAVIIDPGAESNVILDYIEEQKFDVRAIFLTHGHFDHITALPAVKEATGADVYVHKLELDGVGSTRSQFRLRSIEGIKTYADGDEIDVGNMHFLVMETPGHTWGSVTLICGDVMFSGDTLFKDSMGRTDLGGDTEAIMASLRKLSALPGDYEVYPGHADTTTLEAERRHNYYMRYANGELPAQQDALDLF